MVKGITANGWGLAMLPFYQLKKINK